MCFSYVELEYYLKVDTLIHVLQTKIRRTFEKKETHQIKHLYLTNFYKMIIMSNEKESLTLNLKLLLMVDSKI